MSEISEKSIVEKAIVEKPIVEKPISPINNKIIPIILNIQENLLFNTFNTVNNNSVTRIHVSDKIILNNNIIYKINTFTDVDYDKILFTKLEKALRLHITILDIEPHFIFLTSNIQSITLHHNQQLAIARIA